MRKVLAGILIFDVVMGILCLVVGTRQYAGDRQLNTREGKIQELRETLAGDVNCEEELAQKIALTFGWTERTECGSYFFRDWGECGELSGDHPKRTGRRAPDRQPYLQPYTVDFP